MHLRTWPSKSRAPAGLLHVGCWLLVDATFEKHHQGEKFFSRASGCLIRPFVAATAVSSEFRTPTVHLCPYWLPPV